MNNIVVSKEICVVVLISFVIVITVFFRERLVRGFAGSWKMAISRAIDELARLIHE